MQYSGKEDEMVKGAGQNRDSGAPASRNVFDEEWEKNQQAQSTLDKQAEIKQALEMAKNNTFRMKKKQSNVTKIELMP